MYLILVDNFIKKLASLRADYENRTKINLETLPQPYTISLFFGKKDIKTRLKQIKFIENWLSILSNKLKPDLKFTSESEIQEHLRGLRILVAVMLYIRSQIDESYTLRSGNHSTLGFLLDDALSLGHGNEIDEDTQACCLLAAQHFIHTNQATTISELEWNRFTIFITKQCNNLDKKRIKNYPITSIMMPLFAIPMEAIGNSVGWLIGDLAAQSYSLLPTRHVITAMFGSGLILLMGTPSSIGIMLLAPTYAGKLLDIFFGVSFAYVLGVVMRFLGTGLGFGLGMTLDLSWKLLCSACSLITSLLGKAQLPPITGFTLVNGHRVMNGIELDVIELEKAEIIQSEHYEKRPIIFTLVEDGFVIKLGNEEAKLTWQPSPEEPIELQKLLSKLSKLKESQSVTIEEIQEEKQEAKLLLA